MAAQAMKPPLRISSGFTPKNFGSHTTRSASLPTSTEPTWWAMPWVRAGVDSVFGNIALDPKIIVLPPSLPGGGRAELASYGRFARCGESLPRRGHSLRVRRHHAEGTHIVQHILGRNRFRSNTRLGKRYVFGTPGSRWWQTINMSRCSSMVLTVKGRVGFVDEGRTFGNPHTLMISGACPPPAPSVW